MEYKRGVVAVIVSVSAVFAAGPSRASSLDGAYIKPAFEACQSVKIVQQNLNPTQKLEYFTNRESHGLQRMPKMEFLSGLTDPRSIATSIELLKLVIDKKITYINTQLDYHATIKSCLAKPEFSDCPNTLAEFSQRMQQTAQKLRRELALSSGPTAAVSESSNPHAHINTALRPIPGLPYPGTGTALTPEEFAIALQDFKKDAAEVEKYVEAQMTEDKELLLKTNPHSLSFYDETMMRVQRKRDGYFARQNAHQAEYFKAVLENPIVAFLPSGTLTSRRSPTSAELIRALTRLEEAGRNEIQQAQLTKDRGVLEFSRLDPEALWLSYAKGQVDLLSFIVSPVTNDVLKEHPQYCAFAQRLLQRLDFKEKQSWALQAMIFGTTGGGLVALGVKGILLLTGARRLAFMTIAGYITVPDAVSLAIFRAVNTRQVLRVRAEQESKLLGRPVTP